MEEIDSLEIDRLIALSVKGDQEAFGNVVQQYYNRVYCVILRVVNQPDDARELAQVTWVKAWQRLGDYKQEARFYTWIYRIAVNASLDFLRRKRRRPEISISSDSSENESGTINLDHHPELADENTARDEIHRDEIRRTFEAALTTLSDDHRTALILREVEGMSYDEIADVMKTRRGTVMSRIFYARKALQATMEKFL